MIARQGKRPALNVAPQATKPLNAVPANAGASTVVGSILLPTLDVKPESNGPWPTASGPKPICLGQWPSSKQKKLVGATGHKTLDTPVERDQALSSLSPAWRSDVPLDSRRSYASVVAPRPTPKPAEDPKPKRTAVKPTIPDIVGPPKRDEGPTQSDNPNNLSLFKDHKETVEALRKELEV